MMVQRSATAWRGASAYLIDLAVAVGLAGGVWLASRSWVAAGLVLIEAGVVASFLLAITGRAVGGRVLRVYSVTAADGRSPGWSRQWRRSVVIGLLHLSVIGPFLTHVLTTKYGQDWVDRRVGLARVALRPMGEPSALLAGADQRQAIMDRWTGSAPAEDASAPGSSPAWTVPAPPVGVGGSDLFDDSKTPLMRKLTQV